MTRLLDIGLSKHLTSFFEFEVDVVHGSISFRNFLLRNYITHVFGKIDKRLKIYFLS